MHVSPRKKLNKTFIIAKDGQKDRHRVWKNTYRATQFDFVEEA